MSSGRPPTLWWRLDLGGGAAARLDHVGVERALHEERTSPRPRASSSNRRMNCSPMMRRFCSGSVTPASAARNRSAASTWTQRHVEVVVERLDHLLGLVLAQEAVVDEDARELVADGAVDEQRRDGRVDAARERADDLVVADLLADQLDLLLDELERRPRRRRLAGVEHEVAAGCRCRAACGPPRGGTGRRRGRARDPPSPATGVVSVEAVHAEPGGCADDAVAVAHPGGLLGRQVAEEQAVLAQRDGRLAELADAGVRRPRRRARPPSPASRSRCPAPGPRGRRGPDRRPARPARRSTPARRRG